MFLARIYLQKFFKTVLNATKYSQCFKKVRVEMARKISLIQSTSQNRQLFPPCLSVTQCINTRLSLLSHCRSIKILVQMHREICKQSNIWQHQNTELEHFHVQLYSLLLKVNCCGQEHQHHQGAHEKSRLSSSLQYYATRIYIFTTSPDGMYTGILKFENHYFW